METSLHKLYLYEDIRRLFFVDDKLTCLGTDNAPMNKRNLKIHKGVDNHLKFRVFDPDRKPVKLMNVDVYARLVSCTTREIVLEKRCRLGTATGMLFLDILEGDIKDKAIGLHEIVIIRSKEFVANQPDEYILDPFFTDFDGNVVATAEITDQGQTDPVDSHYLYPADWTNSSELTSPVPPYCGPQPAKQLVQRKAHGAPFPYYYSKAIPGGRVRNHINGTHTFSVYAENFTGVLEILGTLEETPPAIESNAWFRINPSTMTDFVQFINFSGTEAFFFQGNFMWLRFRYTPDTNVTDPGSLKKIIVR